MLRSKVKLKFQTKLYIEIVKRHHCTNIFEPSSTEILLLEQTRFYKEEKKYYATAFALYVTFVIALPSSCSFLVYLLLSVFSSILLFALLPSFFSLFLFCLLFPHLFLGLVVAFLDISNNPF